MTSRRKFVKQTALTATAYIVAKPFSALASSGFISEEPQAVITVFPFCIRPIFLVSFHR